MTDPRTLVEIADLWVRYPASDSPALRGVHLRVVEGDRVGIVGESGSGKTSLARSLLGLWPPGAGVEARRLELFGQEAPAGNDRSWRTLRGRLVGLIMQNPQTCLTPTMQIEAQVNEVPLRRLGMTAEAAGEETDRLLRVFGLEPDQVMPLYPHQLSGGMCQRAASAAAVAGGRRLLVADEPTSALDIRNQARFLSTLLEAHRLEHLTLVLVSHDLNVIRFACSTIVVMYRGVIVETGPCTDVLSRPAHPYTRSLAGSMDPEYELPPPSDFARAAADAAPETACPHIRDCPLAAEICLEDPGLLELSEESARRTRCWKWESLWQH